MRSDSQTRLLYGANVHANGIRQHYLRYGGSGAPLILLPGITSPAPTWGFVAERLCERFDTYVLDIRGRGLSQAGPDLDYGLDALAQDVVAFVEALDLGGVTVLGHSMGARIGLRAAAQLGASLASLVLVDPPVSGPGRRPYPTPLAWYTESLRLARSGAGAESLRRFTPTWSDEHLRVRAEWLHTCEETAVTAAYEGFHQDDVHKDLRALATPSLLMVAGQGVILPEDVEEIRQLAPALQIAWVESAGHMIPFDDFDGFFRAVDPFFLACRRLTRAPTNPQMTQRVQLPRTDA